jgi:hypothetical protein
LKIQFQNIIYTTTDLTQRSYPAKPLYQVCYGRRLAINGIPGKEYVTLYRRWDLDRPGLLITGNVMVDKRRVCYK